MHIVNVMKKKSKIFILEDCAIQREEIVTFINSCNREFIYASSVKEAKTNYNNNGSDIDLFILDIELPDGNGMDFLQYVRESSNVSPAIITSGEITNKVKVKVEKLGIIALFEKPVEMNELNQTVMNLFHYENYDKTQVIMRK